MQPVSKHPCQARTRPKVGLYSGTDMRHVQQFQPGPSVGEPPSGPPDTYRLTGAGAGSRRLDRQLGHLACQQLHVFLHLSHAIWTSWTTILLKTITLRIDYAIAVTVSAVFRSSCITVAASSFTTLQLQE